MDDPLWGRVDVEHWQQTPCLRGRIAIEQDVKDGRAVFYLGMPYQPPNHTSEVVRQGFGEELLVGFSSGFGEFAVEFVGQV